MDRRADRPGRGMAAPTIDELGRLADDMLTAAPFAVFVTDEEARITWVNPRSSNSRDSSARRCSATTRVC